MRKVYSLLTVFEFDSEPVYGHYNKYIESKIKSYGNKINTHFQSKKYQKRMLYINISHW